MGKRIEMTEKLFLEGYNCSQSVFAAFSDVYGIDQDTALRLSASFGGGFGRLREVCGAVSGMCMIAGLETGSSKKMDDAGKKYNYDVVQKLCGEFKEINGSLICRELLSLENKSIKDTTPQARDAVYYTTRPCLELVMEAAGIMERSLFHIDILPINTIEQIEKVAELAEVIWHEHYDPIIGGEQVNYMLGKYQSCEAMKDQLETGGYHYYRLEALGGLAGYFAIMEEKDALFLSKLYLAKKYRGRDYARKALQFIENYCKDHDLHKIWLTVNRDNQISIQVYEKLGFTKSGTKVVDIGAGYVMDDYIMEKNISC